MAQKVRDLFWLVLLPLSWVYAIVVSMVIKLRSARNSGASILSVGNIHVGGTGKTPVVIQVAEYLKTKKTAILSRGYKSESTHKGLKLDKQSSQGPRLFGDEPWLMAQATQCDVFVGSNRFELIKKFQIASQYQQVLLDDGFQHVQLQRNVNLLILPVDENPWEAACLPLGTLREGILAIKRATLVVLTCSSADSIWISDWIHLVSQVAPQIPCFIAIRKLSGARDEQGAAVDLRELRLGAFCGIARPERFFEDMKRCKTVHISKSFPDHHSYSRSDIQKLVNLTKEHSLDAWITTAKDFPKVSQLFHETGLPLFTAEIEYDFPDSFWQHIEEKCEQAC